MSESVSPQTISEAVARDQRFAVLQHAIAVETDLRDNETIKAIMAAVRADADQAFEDLADVSPENKDSIAVLLVRVRTLVYIRRTLQAILRRGQVAEQSLRAEDRQHQEDE